MPPVRGRSRAPSPSRWPRVEERARLAASRDRLQASLQTLVPDARVRSAGTQRLPGHLLLTIPGTDADALLFGLDVAKIAASSGVLGLHRRRHPALARAARPWAAASDTCADPAAADPRPGSTGADVDAVLAAPRRRRAGAGGVSGGCTMKVLAALSGGVDSAVAAARAVDAGHEVVGVHMALSRTRAQHRTGSRGCCSIEDASDARRAADALGIPYYVWDLSEEFEETVVADFLSEYAAGRTPNPCVRCNEHIKFAALLDRALALGFDAVCTGHYARIVDGPGGRERHRAADRAKDQAYVLAVMGPDRLARSLFPLGEVASKEEVRAEAAARGLSISAKPDSYDICFVADGDTRGFLRDRLGERPGEVVDTEGTVIGSHAGAYGFTVGQRRGLGLQVPAADGAPRYVVETDPVANRVVVGSAALLSVDEIVADDVVWLADDVATGVRDAVLVQIGAHGEPVARRAGRTAARWWCSRRRSAAWHPGQSLVVYDGTQGARAGKHLELGRSRPPSYGCQREVTDGK